MNTALTTLTNKLAARLEMGDGAELIDTLKATAFKGQVSDAQMTALMVVANQYGLNPWTKEIYAFPDRQNGIVPVIGVDGWSRIINSHDQFDGMSFKQDEASCTCTIYRKDRAHPVEVTEWMSECKRANVGPWQSHPLRMLRHKAMIQCARLAFGFVGVYDPDEADRILEKDITPAPPAPSGSRADTIREKLGMARQMETAPDLAEVLSAIEGAPDEIALSLTTNLAARLTSPADKAAAREAFSARRRALREPVAEPVASYAPGELLEVEVPY